MNDPVSAWMVAMIGDFAADAVAVEGVALASALTRALAGSFEAVAAVKASAATVVDGDEAGLFAGSARAAGTRAKAGMTETTGLGALTDKAVGVADGSGLVSASLGFVPADDREEV